MAIYDYLTPQILDDIKHRRVTQRSVAEHIGISEEHLCRVLTTFLQKDEALVAKQRASLSELAAQRSAFRLKLALQVAKGRKTAEDAAAEAECSLRTMFRFLAKAREVVEAEEKAKARETKKAAKK